MPLKTVPVFFLTLISLFATAFGAYDSITPAKLHDRLQSGDTLLILDVREVSEYQNGHIAAPSEQLPLTPANMPWTSGILRANFKKLPKNVDIIVHCASGGRSKSAAAFLADSGYTRIFNMLGGFYGWSYETFKGGFGDGSGGWIGSSMSKPTTIMRDSASLVLYPAAFTGADSLYGEVHFASGKQPSPSDAPASDVAGLFRVTLLDRFGLPLFTGDSVVLKDTVTLALTPHAKTSGALPNLYNVKLSALAGAGVWKPLTCDYRPANIHRGEKVLRQWYDVQASFTNATGPFQKPVVRKNAVSGRTPVSKPYTDLQGRSLRSPGSTASPALRNGALILPAKVSSGSGNRK
jgi:rhodanese-related sulfurtransferase